MRTVLLVTADDELRGRLVRPLRERSVFFAATDDEAVRTLHLTEVDLIIKDATIAPSELGAFAARARELAPSAVIIGVGDDDVINDDADFRLPRPFTHGDLSTLLRQAEGRQQLLQEVAALRLHVPPGRPAIPELTAADLSVGALEQALKEFARALAAGFDLPRMLELFLDAVGEMVRASRAALLLADPTGEFRIRAQRGLAPQIVQSVRLPADRGLPRWLTSQGRLLHVEEARSHSHEPQSREVARDLGLLQAVIAIPLLAHGELVAILTLGQRIVGSAYSRRETEVLFTLSTQFGTAIRDIRLHHQIHREKEYSERILAHMSSGVVTISRDERITTFNRRAEEILQLAVKDVLGHDLRVLPSPLGDMLFETLVRGRSVHRHELQLAYRNLPLEVSTYPIMGDEPPPLGAVLVFEDLSAQKSLAAEKRQADQFQLLTRVVARIADEIKNPLVSISTLMELLEERYDDPDFRHHFATVVRRDVRRVVQVFEKLTALTGEGNLNFELVDVRVAVDEMLASIGATPSAVETGGIATLEVMDEGSGKRLVLNLYRDGQGQLIKADRLHLKKALSYLVWYLMHRSPGDHAKLSLSIDHGETRDESIVRLLVASRTAKVDPEELQRMFDPMHVVQDSLIDVGPAVSQRLIEAQGGRLQVRQSKHELSFLVTLPGAGT